VLTHKYVIKHNRRHALKQKPVYSGTSCYGRHLVMRHALPETSSSKTILKETSY